MIVIVNYGLGNLRSIQKSCNLISSKIIVSSNPQDIDNADKIILPGVGFFKKAMENLKSKRLLEVLNYNVLKKKKPVLGICLGMQIMSDFSEEGSVNGLGWISGKTRLLNVEARIPQVGWNSVSICKNNLLISKQDLSNYRNEFYFVHSYHVELIDTNDGLFETKYSDKIFYSGFCKENIFGVQFHPEKSYDIGTTLISNFINHV
tara:strand:+ start:4328 stop:4942 length:615 start_codon:yes stop_codon:yes gene_type:complete